MNSIVKLSFVLLVAFWPYRILAATGNPSLISTACDGALYKDLCIKTLQSDPRSAAAKTLFDLDVVALDHASSAGNDVRNQVDKLLRETKDEALKEALADCSENFADATDQLADSTKALASKRYSDVNTWVTAAMSDADSCEQGFGEVGGEKSPIVTQSETFSNLCSNVLAITNKL